MTTQLHPTRWGWVAVCSSCGWTTHTTDGEAIARATEHECAPDYLRKMKESRLGLV